MTTWRPDSNRPSEPGVSEQSRDTSGQPQKLPTLKAPSFLVPLTQSSQNEDGRRVDLAKLREDIVTTMFWVGEEADASNGFIANAASAWDGQWQQRYGGVDSPTPRSGYWPASFTPNENPFYIALPYNDLDNSGTRKLTAKACPNAKNIADAGYSWCKNSWLAINHKGKTAYAQWEDVGPFEEDDTAYVFGGAKPKNSHGAKAGLDVSPAVRDYLGLKDVDTTNWYFVAAKDVPDGPWKKIITTSKGYLVN